MRVGSTFLYAAVGKETKHLYILVIEYSAGKYLCFNITSIKEDLEEDLSCVLTPADHNFIKSPSRIYYEAPLNIDAEGIKVLGVRFDKDSVSEEVVTRIIEGAKKSTAIPKRYLKYFSD